MRAAAVAQATRRAFVARLALSTALGSALLHAAPGHAGTLPNGASVVGGAASVSTRGATTTVNQSTANAIINWQSFSVGEDQTVDFQNGNGATLNRVTGTGISSINGQISATGSVYLINANGIVVGKSGAIATGGSFVASALDVGNAAFMAGGAQTFSGTSSASVINLGKVGSLGGNVAMIARTVENDGTINAPKGSVGLIAGASVLLQDTSLNNGLFLVQTGGAGTSVTNTGGIAGAVVELKAQGGNIYALAGNTASYINATGTGSVGGKVWLLAGDAGTTTLSGTSITATNGTAGGFVETSGGTVHVADDVHVSTISTTGQFGTWLLDPVDFTIAASGGDMTGAYLSGELAGGTSVTIKSIQGTQGGVNGDINVNDTVSWSSGSTLTLDAYRNININAAITVAGAGGVTLITGDTGQNGSSGTGVGDYNFGLTSTGFAGSISYTGSGGSLAINGNAYTLLYSLSDLAAISSNSGYYALATNLDATGNTYAAAILGDLDGQLTGLGHTVSNLTITSVASSMPLGLVGTVHSGFVLRDIGVAGGTITGKAVQDIGGLVGANYGTIQDAYSTAAVNGPNVSYLTGGLVGAMVNGTIRNAFAAGAVTVGKNSSYIGGLVGTANSSTIVDAYATGAVTTGASANNVGGLLGGSISDTISSSYATGTVSALGGASVGGLVGQSNSDTISGSYATGAVHGGTTVGGLVGLNYYGTIRDSYATGAVSGSSDNVGGLVGVNQGTISGSYATGAVSGDNYAGGLAGRNNYSTINDAYATGAVSGANYVGGLVGVNYGGTIRDVYAAGAVTGRASIGGLAGQNYQGTISDSYATGAVNGTSVNVGGLVGFTFYGTISDSYASGAVHGGDNVGGLVGFNNNGTISDAYATGSAAVSLSAGYTVGGLVGRDYYGTITDVYATGAVTGNSSRAGGLIGRADSSTVTNGYWDTGTTGKSQSAAGTGLTTAQLQGALPTGFNDSNSLWATGPGLYPYLVAFYPVAPQAISGFAYNSGAAVAPGATIALYTGGTQFGTATSGANGYYYVLYSTPLTKGGVLGGTLTLSGAPTVSGASYADFPVGLSANEPGFNITSGAFGIYTREASYSALGTPYAAAFGASTYAALASNPLITTTAITAATSFSIDGLPAQGGLSVKTLHGDITVDAPLTLTGGNALNLDSYHSILFNAGVTVSGAGSVSLTTNDGGTGGDYSFGLGPSGFAGSLSFTGSGGSLTINGNAYTLLTSMSDLAGIDGGGGYYALANSLVASGTTYTTAVVASLFGTLTGLGHVINGLTINDLSANGYDGLIGQVGLGGVVRDIGVVGGSVISDGNNVGGLAGYNYGRISDAYATAAVSGNSNVGGLVGQNYFGAISDAYATGAVSGTTYVGGLVGDNNYGTINVVHATGAVSGHFGVGGLVGVSYGTISDAYATGAVSGSNNVGGLVGLNFGTVTNGYWDVGTTGQTSDGASSGSTGLTTAQLQGLLPAGFNSSNALWATGAGLYPYLVFFYPTTPQAVSGFAYSAPGTAASTATVGIYAGGSLLTTAISGANGYYYSLVAPNTFSSTGNAVGATLTRSGAGSVSGAAYADTQALAGQNLILPGTTSGIFNISTAATSSSALTTAMPTAFGSGVLSGLLANTAITITDIQASGAFTIDNALSSADKYVIEAAGGDLTIGSGGSVTSTATGDAITLAANGAFINNAGADALSAGGRWLVSSTTAQGSSADVAGGLSGLNYYGDGYNFGIGFASEPGGTSLTGNLFVHSWQPTLVVSADTKTLTYNGYTQTDSYSVSGYLGSDQSADTLSGMVTGLTTSSKNAAPYALTGAGSLASSENYAISYSTLAGTLTIGQAALALTYAANPGSSTYGAALSPVSGVVTQVGLVNGDTLASLGTANWTTSATLGANAGSYGITGSGLSDGNYTIIAAQALGNTSAYTIGQAALSVTADSLAKNFGQSDLALTYTITYGQLYGADSLSGALTRLPGEGVGSYAIRQGSLAATANYSLTYIGGTMTINAVQANDNVNFNPATQPQGNANGNNSGNGGGGSQGAGQNGGSQQQYGCAASGSCPYPANQNPAPGVYFGVN